MPRSIRAPFQVEGGSISFTDDPSTVTRQKLINVAVTDARERIGYPNYGGNLSGAVFEDHESLEATDYKADLSIGFQQYVSNAVVRNIDFRPSDFDESVLEAVIVFQLPLGTAETLVFPLGTIDGESSL